MRIEAVDKGMWTKAVLIALSSGALGLVAGRHLAPREAPACEERRVTIAVPRSIECPACPTVPAVEETTTTVTLATEDEAKAAQKELEEGEAEMKRISAELEELRAEAVRRETKKFLARVQLTPDQSAAMSRITDELDQALDGTVQTLDAQSETQPTPLMGRVDGLIAALTAVKQAEEKFRGLLSPEQQLTLDETGFHVSSQVSEDNYSALNSLGLVTIELPEE
jgi:hypothetical protein